MHPVLWELPWGSGLKLHSYGLMMALGFLGALAWIRRQSPREGLSVKEMTDLAFILILTAIAGSRLTYIIVEWRRYASDPMAIFRIWEGGLVFYGGLIACIGAAWAFLKKHRLSFWKVSDVFMPGVALGHALGRVGCFLAGCCYGRVCNPHAWYAVMFPEGQGSLAPPGLPLYPSQLMEAMAEFCIFVFLAYRSGKKAFDGQILLLYLILYSVLRIFLELFRGDGERGFVIEGVLSTSQFLGVLLIVFAGIVLISRKRRLS